MNTYKILSIDGGGIRGIIPLVVLDKLGLTGSDFDLIVGTSTGGIIAAGLSKGLTPKEMLNVYLKEGKNIFKKRWFLPGIIQPKYSTKNLHKILSKYLTNDIPNSVDFATTSYDKNTGKIYIGKSWDTNLGYADLATSTSAAPSYFDPFKINKLSLYDGGIYANNPVLIAKKLAKDFTDSPLEVLSLGTGVNEEPIFKKENILNWAKEMPSLFLDSNFEFANWLICSDDFYSYKRINTIIDSKHKKMDNVKPSNLKALVNYGENIFNNLNLSKNK